MLTFHCMAATVMTSSTPVFGVGDASFLAAGGTDGLRRLVEEFYQAMDTLPEAACVRKLYPESLELAKDKLATFLCGWLGGPREYAQRFGPISIPSFHTRWQVGEREREAWLACMAWAIERQAYAPEFAEYLLTQLRVPAERVYQASRAVHGEG